MLQLLAAVPQMMQGIGGLMGAGNLAMGSGGGLSMADTAGPPSLWEPDILNYDINAPEPPKEPPEMPKPPNPWAYGGGDVSGFANYGMQAPPLPDTQAELGGLMSMSTAGIQNQPRQAPQAPKGGLMAYLDSLGV